MKKITLFFAFILGSLALAAQSAQYTNAMTKGLVQLDSAKNAADFQAVANTFSRIAGAEPKEWLPLYYASFGNLISAFILYPTDVPKAVLAVDQAQASLDKAKLLAPQESELAVMQAYILIGRLVENPMGRGAEITPQVYAELGKAAALNPDNPRAPYLQGTYVLNMPEFYGGGAANAKPHFEKAAALFEKETDRKLLPRWGKEENTKMLEQVKSSLGGK